MDSESGSRPSVVLITVDDLRYDAIFEDEDSTRPSFEPLRNLVNDGILCKRMFSAASGTKRSFPGILSGYHAWRWGGDTGRFDTNRPYLAEDLHDRGYETASFHSNPFLNPQYGYDRGFDYFNSGDTREGTVGFGSKFTGQLTDLITRNQRLFSYTRKAISLIGSQFGVDPRGRPYLDAKTITDRAITQLEDAHRPYFLWTHYMDVHSPWYPRSGTRSQDIGEREAIRAFHRYRRDPEGVDKEIIKLLERLYYGEAEYLIPHIGRLLSAINDTPGDTVVLFVADHGEAFGEHGYYRHPWELYNELIHVPCLVGGLGYDDTQVISTPTSTLDVRPTLLQATSGETPDICDGIALQDQLSEEGDEREVISLTGPTDRGKVCITDGRWKLIEHRETGSYELYDLHEDFGETTDCSNKHPDLVQDKATVLNDWVADILEDEIQKEEKVEISTTVQRRLEHLGYADETDK